MTVKMVAFKNHYFCCEQVLLSFFMCDTWMMSSWHPNLIGKVCRPSWTSFFFFKKKINFIHCHFTGEDNLILFDLYQPIIVKNKFLILLNVNHSKIKAVHSLCYYVDTLNHMLPITATKNWMSGSPFHASLSMKYIFSCNLLIFACDAIWLIWQSRSLTYILCIHSCLAAWS